MLYVSGTELKLVHTKWILVHYVLEGRVCNGSGARDATLKIENMYHVAGTKVCHRNRNLFRKKGHVIEEKLLLQHVSSSCPCNVYPSLCRS